LTTRKLGIWMCVQERWNSFWVGKEAVTGLAWLFRLPNSRLRDGKEILTDANVETQIEPVEMKPFESLNDNIDRLTLDSTDVSNRNDLTALCDISEKNDETSDEELFEKDINELLSKWV